VEPPGAHPRRRGGNRALSAPEGAAQSKAAAFVEAIRTGEEPPATATDALRATAVKEAVYEADRTGRAVEPEL